MVRMGKIKVFQNDEIGPEAVLASSTDVKGVATDGEQSCRHRSAW
jgi:hypothetical protein